jgi:RNA polymerase sigma-70 factor (sigma-E family)
VSAAAAEGAHEVVRSADRPPVELVDTSTASPLEELFATSRPRLVAFARTILADRDEAEEVVQEAFARTLARWDHVENKDDPLPYVRTTIVNLCRGRFRRRPAPLRPVRHEPSSESVAGTNARREAVLAALATLPDRQREVAALRFFGQLSTAETAEALGISPGTVKAHLHRATHALASRLQEYRDV